MLDYEIVSDEWFPRVGDTVKVLNLSIAIQLNGLIGKIVELTTINSSKVYIENTNKYLLVFYNENLEFIERN